MSDPYDDTVPSDPTLEKLRRFTLGITVGRLVLAPLLGWLIFAAHPAISFWLMVLAGFGALLEGTIHLFFSTRTRISARLDRVADRLIPLAAFVALYLVGQLPIWVLLPALAHVVALLLGRDLPESFGNDPWVTEPGWLSFLNIVAQDLLILIILAIQGPGIGLDLLVMPAEMLVVALVIGTLVMMFLHRARPEAEFGDDGSGEPR